MSELPVRPLRGHSKLVLLGFLCGTYAVASISTVITVPSISTWYATLAKPSFNPPNQVFGPVWTLLYTLMAIAAWLVWRHPDSKLRRAGLIWFGIQLFFNFAWSFLFFRSHQAILAFGDILLLALAIAISMSYFFRVSKAAGWMMVPYLAWVSFASVLNFAIWQMN